VTIVRIVAHIDCDECGKRYHTLLDEGGDSVFDAAVNGRRYYPENKEYIDDGGAISVSYQDGKMLCTVCTKAADMEAEGVGP
jgi:hypothetical protein